MRSAIRAGIIDNSDNKRFGSLKTEEEEIPTVKANEISSQNIN
jgi:hypothetical protein